MKLKKQKRITRIYLVWNINGKPWVVYIGKEKSHQKLSRKYRHRQTYSQQIEFDYIDQVNGWDVKKWKPLETKWIKWFKEQGYEVMNKNNGGGGVEFHTEFTKTKLSNNKERALKISASNKGRKDSELTKRRKSKAMKGRIISKETARKISIANTGMKQSEETKLKKSIANKGRPKPKGFGKLISKANSKAVKQYTKEGKFIKEWKSGCEVEKELGIHHVCINMCVRGKTKIAGGFIWKYK